MSSPARHLQHTLAEYVAFERQSATRHEYIAGEIYAMAGGTPLHARLTFETLALLRPQLKGDCVGYSADLRVRIAEADVNTYPDGTIVCGKLEVDPADALSATNPRLIVEVTSRTTESYDRGDKLSFYQQLASIHEVLFVSHREARLTVVRREGARWNEYAATAGEVLQLKSVMASLSVDDLYRGLALDDV